MVGGWANVCALRGVGEVESGTVIEGVAFANILLTRHE